ncbi:putative claudin-24 [Megalops cyprinoides]|uniref:putative claudin-24 n=1 Tax=Megalops cyprinoides TaxID=118141 RepID=UPI001865099E|nr:putative claudin-24 [Megalops cyprinoides]
MVLVSAKVVQRWALFVSFVGLVITFVTTFLPLWKTLNTDLNEMENWYEGLWHTCIFQDEAGMQCKAFDSFLALPPDVLASRVLMIVSIVTGIVAVGVAFFGLEGVDLGPGRQGLKRGLLILGGVLSWVSGITTLLPISLVAYVTVVEFWDDTVPDIVPRWEFGEAMFSGWFSGFFLVMGGTFLFVSVCMEDHRQHVSLPDTQEKPRTPQYLKTEFL